MDDFKEPQFELFFQHQSIGTVDKPLYVKLQDLVDHLSTIISYESSRFEKEPLQYDRGAIDMSNCVADEEEEEKKIENFYTPEK